MHFQPRPPTSWVGYTGQTRDGQTDNLDPAAPLPRVPAASRCSPPMPWIFIKARGPRLASLCSFARPEGPTHTCRHWTLAGSLCAEIASVDTFRMTSSISGTSNLLDKIASNMKGKNTHCMVSLQMGTSGLGANWSQRVFKHSKTNYKGETTYT